jgi:DNA-binding transcriptional LysR family regulator
LTSGHMPKQTIRIGIPVDYAGSRIPAALSRFRERWPDVSYNVGSAPVDEMLRDLQHGVLDIVLATFTERPTIEARHIWTQELVWVHSDAVKLDPDGPVPLVSYGGDHSSAGQTPFPRAQNARHHKYDGRHRHSSRRSR